MKSLMTIGSVLLVLAGCVTYRLAPNELEKGQRITYIEGYEAIMEEYPVG